MTHIIRTITLGVFLSPCFLVGSEKPAPTEEQKKQWAADAEKYKAMVAALGGKMGDPDFANEQKKISIVSLSPKKSLLDQPAKL